MEQTQHNHWGFAFGATTVPEEWSKRKNDSKVNESSTDDTLDLYADDAPKNVGGKYMQLSTEQKNILIDEITKHLKAGAKTGPEVLSLLESDGQVPIHEKNGQPVAPRCIYRYVRIVKAKLGIEPEPFIKTKVIELYKSGVTNRKQIMKTLGCSESIVRKTLLQSGFIKKVRKSKKSRK